MAGDVSLWIGIGAALGLWLVARSAPPKEMLRWADAGLYALLGGLIGARLYFVLLHLDYFRAHPLEAPQVWLGGVSWPGAALGGLLAAGIVAAAYRAPLAAVADRLSPLAAPLAVAAWLGCWGAGCAYGPLVAEGSPFALLAISEDGARNPRLPVQLLAAFSLVAIFAAIELRPPALKRGGQKAALIALVLSTNLLCFSLLRADPAPNWAGMRPDTWAALVFAALSGIAFIASFHPVTVVKGAPARPKAVRDMS